MEGDFLTALLAEAVLVKEPHADDPLRRACEPRRRGRRREAAGGSALMNRVGHAFFKTQRYADERRPFGGEVSGHYYFRDFYCADSGTLPALLMLELLSKKGAKLSELTAQLRSRYFISGEINSEVADAPAKMAEIERRYADADHPPRRHLGRLRRLALQRAPVEHRAAAAPVPRVARLQGGHGTPARRGAGPHSCLSPCPPRARSAGGAGEATGAGIHCLPIPTPFLVGRVNCYLIEDDPLTLVDCGPNSGKALDELEQALAARGHAASRTSA